MREVVLSAQHLSKYFISGKHIHKVVDGVSFSVYRGETLGIVGESGSGKTTLGRTLMRLYEPDQGEITFDGHDITHLKRKKLRSVQRDFQMIFQDPFDSLSPRMTVGEILAEPLIIQKSHSRPERSKLVSSFLDKVGLPQTANHKKIHEFSGGERQRVGIARALIVQPKMVIADEPVSALDVSVQAQILNLLKDLQAELSLTCLFISHDLNVVHYMSDRVAVMRHGHMLELATKQQIYENPVHPYTKSLLSAIPVNTPHKRGMIREVIELPPRSLHPPHLIDIGGGHLVAADVITIDNYRVKETQNV
ncbi:ABC transporter ATP-binding protein [Fictibacillus iocasae]|uniref:ABC transporter ATP-binding protein n=1 Tax=Fictibacillus iocasae TaxID=2715437 RepID=A0ABW2NWJ9_9BACL